MKWLALPAAILSLGLCLQQQPKPQTWQNNPTENHIPIPSDRYVSNGSTLEIKWGCPEPFELWRYSIRHPAICVRRV
jgi:hypothetical protein